MTSTEFAVLALGAWISLRGILPSVVGCIVASVAIWAGVRWWKREGSH